MQHDINGAYSDDAVIIILALTDVKPFLFVTLSLIISVAFSCMNPQQIIC